MHTEAIEAYLAQILVPALSLKAIVIMNHLSSHKSPTVIRLLHGADTELWYLPAYSADYNPIDPKWSNTKKYLRSIKARDQGDL